MVQGLAEPASAEKMPPPELAELPVMIVFSTRRSPAARRSIPPPDTEAEFPVIVQPEKCTFAALPSISTPPPKALLLRLLVMVQLVKVTELALVSLETFTAAPLPPKMVLPSKLHAVNVSVAD